MTSRLNVGKAWVTFIAGILVVVWMIVNSSVFADSPDFSESAMDLSRLANNEQGQANVLICIVQCERNEVLDARYERTRYDQYYSTETGFVLSDPTDPDSELIACGEISCEPPERRAAIGSICSARHAKLNDYARCVLQCTSIGELYDEEMFDNEPFSTYRQNMVEYVQHLCERVNDKPFIDYDSSCPEILFVDQEPINCAALNNLLDGETSDLVQPKPLNLNESETALN